MKKAILPIFYCIFVTDDKPNHDFCPPGNTACCEYNNAKAKREIYHHTKFFFSNICYYQASLSRIIKRGTLQALFAWCHPEIK
jgi:hypothetical protein